jgi:hypothetical protein
MNDKVESLHGTNRAFRHPSEYVHEAAPDSEPFDEPVGLDQGLGTEAADSTVGTVLAWHGRVSIC